MKTILSVLCCLVVSTQLFAQTHYQWQKSGSLILARQRFNVALLPNREVLVIGGMTSDGTITNTTEIYNPNTQQTRYGSPMNEPHGECEIIKRSDGTIVVVSGVSNYTAQKVTKSVELYNPATQQWKVIGSLLQGRRQHCAIALTDDEILVVGGRDEALNTYNTTEIFTISTGKSRYAGALPHVVNNARIARAKNEKILLFGGREYGDGSNQSENVYAYDVITDNWNIVSKLLRTTSYPALTTLLDGRIVTMGGKLESGFSFIKEIYIESNNTFRLHATMNMERHLGYIHQLTSTLMLAFGGKNNSNINLASAEYVSLESKQVSSAPSMNVPHTNGCSIEVPLISTDVLSAKKIIVFSGISNNGILTPSIECITVSNSGIEGIINIYTPVTNIGTKCTPEITVADSKGFTIGDKVLIMQMQGADIIPDNTDQYGKVTDYHNTGNHEFNRITSINNNTLGLQSRLLHSYDVSKKVQLIRVPEYQSISVTNTLTAKEWDGTTGGVLVFDVKDTLTLNGQLNVTGKGFRGGQAISSQDFPWNYVTDYIIDESMPGYGSAKGEGIAGNGIFPMINGRGSAANGGGGGNNHNGGGGGGANYGAGGNGGYGWKSTSYAGNNEDAQGLGGKSIEYDALTTVYQPLMMGGGGGAGHTNQTTLGSGGAGGGIIIVKAGHLLPNDYSIIADGAPGKDGVEDGAGGGGGGGAIYLDVPNITSRLVCSVNGGKGGDIRLNDYAVAPGGGGGSGLVCFTNRVPSANIEAKIEGGIAGISIYQTDSYGSMPGNNGIVTGVEPIHEASPISIGGGNKATLPNSYYKVISIFPDLGGVQLTSNSGLCPDDKVLIIQMQGAFINTDNSPDYGKIQSLVLSGNYEFARIASISSIGIIFRNKLKNFYSPADGSVQLIRVPEYRDLSIDSPLSCQAWNGETGGVLVFSVENTLRLNSFIDVTGKGFRGGAASNAVNNPPTHTGDYVSAADSTRFSRKGEGIFGWRNPDHRAGRGAAASGGGGGNNHNAGGGGGSYIGCGGMGGFGWEQYSGDRSAAQGMGGYPIDLIANNIFMGGGGGAGHSNELTGTAGAAGGGIVIIQAKEIISNNQSIIAKGDNAKNAPYDGTGGGGAGGTILLDCRRFINRIELDVRGGSGGSTTEHRDGPGGGGGGGLIAFTAPETPDESITLVNGGGSGTNRDFNKDGATNGCPGTVKNNLSLPGDISIIAMMNDRNADDINSPLPYPHPASETVFLALNTNERVTVFDIFGNVIEVPSTQNSEGISLDVSMIHAGNYYIRVGNFYFQCVVIH